MVSVTRRISHVKQPRGGYINPKDMSVVELDDAKELNPEENVSPALIGLVVDYLTRMFNGTSKEEAFRVSMVGAIRIGEDVFAKSLLSEITGFDDRSIINACKLVGFDVVVRFGPGGYKSVEGINADKSTIENIKIMVERSLKFIQVYGPITKDGFSLKGGYTDKITSGDGDFLTEDTLWDFKVLKGLPNINHTLQLLIYYLMGKRSVHSEFDSIKNIGVFNPRLNKIYTLSIDSIEPNVIDVIERDVIGYEALDKQVMLVMNKYIIPEKEFDFKEVQTQEELQDILEGFEKLKIMPQEEINKYF